MKKIHIILISILCGLSSCTSVLDKEPLDIISDDVLWNDPVLIDNYLLQCYAEMCFFNEMPYGATQDWFNCMYATGFADESTSAWTQTPKTHWLSISGGDWDWWGYPTVRKLNVFIEKMETAPVDEAVRTARTAEARFLRAFAYFNMVKRYGGVPLILKAQQLSDSPEELYPKRATEEAVYQFILDEMNDIIDNRLLPDAYGAADLGRPTLYAAAALKSRAAMYAGSIASWGTVQLDGLVGIPADKKEHFWQESLNASNRLLYGSPFALYEKYPDDRSKNYRNIFLDENNCEVIFSEIYDGKSGKGHSWDMWQNPSGYNAWAGGQQNCVYLEFVESYENIDGSDPTIDREKVAQYYTWTLDELWGKKDPRFKASIYTQGTPWTHEGASVTLDYHVGIFVDGQWINDGFYEGVPALGVCANNWRPTPFGILKYLDESSAMIPERYYSKTDWIVFRLGEIYLNFAEAAFELNKPDSALWAVNKIRARAGMPELQSITREQIRHERKIELAFEGNRYWDVRRWRTAVQDLSHAWHGMRYKLDWATQKYYVEIVDNICGTPEPYFNEMHYYWPIAQSRTQQNPNLLPNNPGWR